MKKIYITESQLKHALKLMNEEGEVVLSVTGSQRNGEGESVPSSQEAEDMAKATKILGQNKIKTVVPFNPKNGSEVKRAADSGALTTENIEHNKDVVPQVVDYIINNYTDIDCDSSITEVNNAIQDAYIECFGEEMEYDNKPLFREIRNMLIDRLCTRTVNESTIVFTKKQIKEAKKAKRIAESKVFTKADIVKNL